MHSGSDGEGRSPLTMAASHGQIQVVDHLIRKHGQDPKGKPNVQQIRKFKDVQPPHKCCDL